MKRTVLAVLLSFALVPAAAEDLKLKPTNATPVNSQQERSKMCNATATSENLKGEDRKSFMSSCLKGEAGPGALTTREDKRKLCNADATQRGLKGDVRKTFMSACLKKG
jgi:hypothetical protein